MSGGRQAHLDRRAVKIQLRGFQQKFPTGSSLRTHEQQEVDTVLAETGLDPDARIQDVVLPPKQDNSRPIVFARGDLIVCDTSKGSNVVRTRCGDGPFEVTGIIPVPPCTVSTVGHTQWLNLKVPGGSDLIQKVYITPEGMEIGGSKISFSGCWFKKHK